MIFDEYERLTPAHFRFSQGRHHPTIGEKFRGLQRFGPYAPLANRSPSIAFVFPKEFRDDALKIYFALRNGLGYFKGFENTFRVKLEKEQVFDISDFSLEGRESPEQQAGRYSDAILKWLSTSTKRPDIFVIVHPRTFAWEDPSPYRRCKAQLLAAGCISQSVTVDLVRSSTQFDWAVANIALAIFTKLGGIPWVVDRTRRDPELVVGMGRADLRDPHSRRVQRTIAFATCTRGNGAFAFNVYAEPVTTRNDYVRSLADVVSNALRRVEVTSTADLELNTGAFSIHLPKEYGRDEEEAIARALSTIPSAQRPSILKITDEPYFFLVDTSRKDGTPSRGTMVRVGQDDWLLYTEGNEERQTWRSRTPSALRVRVYSPGETRYASPRELVRQVLDLSQVNYRAFNARSRPVSLVYSQLVAKTLAHLSPKQLSSVCRADGLSERMWFL